MPADLAAGDAAARRGEAEDGGAPIARVRGARDEPALLEAVNDPGDVPGGDEERPGERARRHALGVAQELGEDVELGDGQPRRDPRAHLAQHQAVALGEPNPEGGGEMVVPAGHGSTAVASISTRAPGSRSAIAG